jgi:H+-translocating NAD(P) transhydrogenase subunit beta
MTPTWIHVAYLVAAVSFILALKALSSPRNARRGALIGSAGAALAVVLVFAEERPNNSIWIVLTIALGSLIGTLMSRRVPMTAMPQLVAIFNGVGGGAAALVALLELSQTELNAVELAATAFTLLIGATSFSGSMVTFLKLQELMTTRPVTFPGGPVVFGLSLAASVGLIVWTVTSASLNAGILLMVAGLIVGILLVLPVGGADVPVAISLLNAFTGLAVAATGYVLGSTLLLVAGTLVGASGTILTRAMAKAMGRSVQGILFGAFKGSTAGSVTTGGAERPVKSAGPDDIAVLLAYARRVVIVPGYGLAVAQAQHTIHELVQVLEKRGVEVAYGIHAVAGRMPGHMNVLMAEANVPYEQLLEMDEANAMLRTSDVALVVGANDVVNPAALTSPGSPIYGMPILDVATAQSVVFLKRSMRPGFAGIENELLYDSRTTLLFGDAKDSLNGLLASIKVL